MKSSALRVQFIFLLPVLLAGCRRIPGKPVAGDQVPRPSAIQNFPQLYAENCSGCHGANGQHGAALDLANPEYQALIDNATLRSIIAQGRPGTLMPAFARSAGGTLTDAQIDALVQGMRSHWARPAEFTHIMLPAYTPSAVGDVKRGAEAYETDCATCHDDAGAAKDTASAGDDAETAGSITDKDFLALVSDRFLHTIAITGRPDLGMPDWRDRVPDQPMSEQEIEDVVAWLSAQRATQPLQMGTTTEPAAKTPTEKAPEKKQTAQSNRPGGAA